MQVGDLSRPGKVLNVLGAFSSRLGRLWKLFTFSIEWNAPTDSPLEREVRQWSVDFILPHFNNNNSCWLAHCRVESAWLPPPGFLLPRRCALLVNFQGGTCHLQNDLKVSGLPYLCLNPVHALAQGLRKGPWFVVKTLRKTVDEKSTTKQQPTNQPLKIPEGYSVNSGFSTLSHFFPKYVITVRDGKLGPIG